MLHITHVFCFFKQKTAYEMRISDWSSDVCSSDLHHQPDDLHRRRRAGARGVAEHDVALEDRQLTVDDPHACEFSEAGVDAIDGRALRDDARDCGGARIDRVPRASIERGAFALIDRRSEEHTSELQSLMRNSYAVFCLKKK